MLSRTPQTVRKALTTPHKARSAQTFKAFYAVGSPLEGVPLTLLNTLNRPSARYGTQPRLQMQKT